MQLNKAQGKLQQRVVGTGLSAITLLAALQTPLSAGAPRLEPELDPKLDPLDHLRPGGKSLTPHDAWVAKYQVGPDGVGKVLWKKQLSTSKGNRSNGVATDSSGNVLISGSTEGALGGSNQGHYDGEQQ